MSMSPPFRDAIAARGVLIESPETVYFAPDLDPCRFHEGAVVHAGCRLYGAETSLGPGAEIGAESPVTLRNCQLGAGARLAGGFAEQSTFLDGASAGDGLHARPGTLLEEGAGVAHTVGLKQTILLPFVEFGSLVNFCDALVAGGTGPKDHSEVGSSYVHFNFTPHGDKATASLVGDVPSGALLRSPRIFLGGQGGLVGPRRIAFGTVVPAGTVLRRDIRGEGTLVRSRPAAEAGLPVCTSGDGPWDPANFGRVGERAATCLAYLGNVLALRSWYRLARTPAMERTPWGAACLDGALRRLDAVWAERLKRLGDLAALVRKGGDPGACAAFAGWPARSDALAALWAAPEPEPPSAAREALARLHALAADAPWPRAVQSLRDAEAESLRDWLGTRVAAAEGAR